MAQSSEECRSRLEALPNELLMAIFEELAPEEKKHFEIAQTTLSSRSPPRSNYYDLCLVSKRINIFARPCLFKNVTIEDSLSLARLCSTIDRNQSLGEKILELSIDVLFKRANNRCNHLLTPAEEAEVLVVFYSLTGERRRVTPGGDIGEHGDLVGILCFELLKRTANLRSLRLVIRGYRSRIPLLAPDEERTRLSYSALFHRVRSAILPHEDGAAALFLPEVENLTLNSDRDEIGPEEFGHFLGLPSLKRVTHAWNPTFWSCFAPHGVQSSIGTIASFFKSFEWTRQGDLEDMAQLFPAIEVLTLSFGITGRFWHIPAVPGMHRELSTALGRMTALRTLVINSSPSQDFSIHFCRYMVGKSSDTPARAISLANLANLRHLEVASFLVAQMSYSGFDGSTAVPHEILPQALETLTLLGQRKCSHPQGKDCWDSITITLGFLETLGRNLSRFDKLKTVGYSFDPSSCGNPTLAAAPRNHGDEAPEDSTRWRLLAIDECYSGKKVEFFVQERASEVQFEVFRKR